MPVLAAPDDLRALLARSRTVAVVGLSPDPDRDSHRVASYLADRGYRVLGVNPKFAARAGGEPAGGTFRGERVYPALADLPAVELRAVDIALVFRRSEEAAAIAAEVARLGLPALWFQLGTETPEAVAAADRAGLAVVAGSCIMVAHRLLVKRPGRS